MTDRRIERFVREGIVKDTSEIGMKKPFWEKDLQTSMRDKGWVPVLDIDPVCVVNYNPEKETFEYRLTIQGVYLGKVRASEVEGICANRERPLSTRANRSEQHSEESE